jgi:hypothetical protein
MWGTTDDKNPEPAVTVTEPLAWHQRCTTINC